MKPLRWAIFNLVASLSLLAAVYFFAAYVVATIQLPLIDYNAPVARALTEECRRDLFLSAIFVVPPVAWVVVAIFYVRPARRALQCAEWRVCPSCGYELRATPERCPECGGVPSETGDAT